MKNDLPIGFFDSGVGGLSVFSKFRKLMPAENVMYYADLKNLPYGNKSQEELIGFARNIMDFFVSQNVKAVVIACNTSSALAYDSIKNDYDVKIYPIIQSCAKVISQQKLLKVGVFATKGTVKSKAYSREIQKYNSMIEVCEIACPNWVSIVEGKLSDNEDIKFHAEEMLEFNPDKIILGCTHYPFLLNELSEYISKDIFIDPADIFVDFIKKDLVENGLINEVKERGSETFFVSAEPEEFYANSKMFYNPKSKPILI